jgi:hypothetical protein
MYKYLVDPERAISVVPLKAPILLFEHFAIGLMFDVWYVRYIAISERLGS